MKKLLFSVMLFFYFFLQGQTQQEKQLDSVLVKYTGKSYEEYMHHFNKIDSIYNELEKIWIQKKCPLIIDIKRPYFIHDFQKVKLQNKKSDSLSLIHFRKFNKIIKVERKEIKPKTLIIDKPREFITIINVE